MTLRFQWITNDVAVAGQLAPGDVAQAAQNGFQSIVNNRPDLEGGPEQPTSASIADAASDAGVAYAFLPVQSGFQSPEEIARMRELLDTLPKPVLAFCRSGSRSGRLIQAAAALAKR
ncbi:MAG TPA: TIGR01244 family sulfur transferase [Casimicrobiaceae bacterium]|nr:TIGR01244 family sulfur transferase [Casimicrobiaceae bacterium]